MHGEKPDRRKSKRSVILDLCFMLYLHTNITSQNGTPELVSLLQYMKETTLENPLVTVKTEKLRRLDEIVREVRESKEWEEMNVNVYSRGKEIILLEQICKKLSKGKSEAMIADEVERDIGFVRQVIDVVSAFAPMYDENAVWNAWIQAKGSN